MKREMTLFAFPFAGGSKHSYNFMKDLFPEYIQFFPVELPGRGSRIQEEPKVDIHDLVEDLYHQLKERLNGDYALYGHSMGSAVVYALVKRVIKENVRLPSHLFVSGRAGPSCPERSKRHLLTKDEFKRSVIDMGGIPEEVAQNDALMDFFEPILRADFQLLETMQYSPSVRLDIPITVMIGEKDLATVDEAMLWQNETSVPIQMHQFKGGHFFIFDYSQKIADLIADTLNQ